MGNGQRGIGNGQWGMGNRQWGMGKREEGNIGAMIYLNRYWGKLFILLLIILIPGKVTADKAVANLDAGQGKIILYPARILLTNNSGKILDEYNLEELEIKDGCLIPPGEKLIIILGQKGAPRGERLALFSVKEGKIKNEWIDEDHGYNPWKIMTADVDGDGRVDICIGMWKKTRFHPVFDNRLFIYNWDGEGLTPKWLGSRLSQPYVDFDFKDIDNDGINELIALEMQRNAKKRVMSYKWSGFGFVGYKIIKQDLNADNLTQVESKKEAGK